MTSATVFAGEEETFTSERAAKLYEESKNWPPEQKAAVLKWLEANAAREQIKKRYGNAADLAAAVDVNFVITPALALIAGAIETVLSSPRHNLLVTVPPQEGKSTLCGVWTPIRSWQLNPNRRIILASYGDDLAHMHSLNCRTVIEQHGSDVVDQVTGALVEDKLGLKIAPKSRRVDAWKIDGARGGMSAVGLGSSITGKSADLFIIDDPYKNMQEADSATHRKKVDEWMSSVALTRLSPEASIILIQTRWHPEDLAGKTLAGELDLPKSERTWRYINIPAISEEGIPDALGRPPGVPMQSARDGVDAAGNPVRRDFTRTRRDVGERTWYALYQGSPRNPAGGLFERAWFDPRLGPDDLINPVAAVVGVDPADSGEGDETGLIGGTLLGDGSIALTEDWSGQMTSDQWSKRAVELALTIGAREIALEGYATFRTYKAVIERAWLEVHKEAQEALAQGENLTPVQLRALTANQPFLVSKYTEAGDPVGRAAKLRQDLELKRARVVEYKLGVFEDQACDWQPGQHCPDRVAAAVIAHWRLSRMGTGRADFTSPLHQKNRPEPPAWMTRSLNDRSFPTSFDRR